MTAVNDSRQPRQSKAAAAGAVYGIVRQESTSPTGQTISRWLVNFKRQSQELQRAFYDQTLGSREAALALAVAWRDAVLRLIPPVTKRQAQTRRRSNNTSGVPGVTLVRIRGRIMGWRAVLQTPQRSYSKTFSIKLYGEENAKERAIAARHRMLKQYGSDAFVTLNARATQEATEHFGTLLNTAQPVAPLDSAQISQRICILNQWFDQLFPGQLYVSLKVYPDNRGRVDAMANVRISLIGIPNRAARRGLSLTTHSYAQRLPELWQFIENTITAWHGSRRWQDFAARYQQAFMSSNAQEGFKARLYGPPQGYPECLKPPAALLPMLGDFRLPELSYLPWAPQHSAVQAIKEGVFLHPNEPRSELAILPSAVKSPSCSGRC